MRSEEEERRPDRPVLPRFRADLAESPVRICSAQPMHGRMSECSRFAKGSAGTTVEEVRLQPGRRSAHADACPPPRGVDIVREGDRKAPPVPARGFDPEPRAQSFERRIEWIERRPSCAEAAVRVAAALDFLDPRELEERLGEVVTDRTLPAFDRVPGIFAKRNGVAEADVARADRIEHPARAPLDPLGNHGRSTRAQCTSAGLGSSRAHIASTYGGRWNMGRDPRASVIAQRLPSPCMRTGAGGSPIASRYAIRGRSTPQTAASPCHSQRRGFTSISLKRPSRTSRLNSTCDTPHTPSARRRRSASSTRSGSQRASATRAVPISGGVCASLRPLKSPSASPARARYEPTVYSVSSPPGTHSCMSGSNARAYAN